MAKGFEFRTRRTRTLYPLKGVLSAAAQYASTLWVVSLLLLPFAHAAALRVLVATVERVRDGDTIIALFENGTKLRIRLLGIDAPEIPHGNQTGQPFGEEARDYLDHLIGGKVVRVDAYGPDQYQRSWRSSGMDG